MKVTKAQLRKLIQNETKKLLSESDIAQGLENVSAQAETELYDRMNHIVQDVASSYLWKAQDKAVLVAIKAASHEANVPMHVMSKFFNQGLDLDEEMDVSHDLIDSTARLASAIVQGYLKANDPDFN